jgi:adenosine kinase
MAQRLFVIGSVAFDHIMNMPGRYADFIMPEHIHKLNVSFTVETFRREYGGTGGNCAYSLGLLGHSPNLISSFGKDSRGYRDHLTKVGVDFSTSLVDRKLNSAQGFVITDKDDNQVWSFYPGAMEGINQLQLENLEGEDIFVALLPTHPVAQAKFAQLLADKKIAFMFDPAFYIPNIAKEQLLIGLENARIIIGNDYEIDLLERRTETRVADWVKGGAVVVKTLGAKGSVIYTEAEEIAVRAVVIESMEDPTGAGDAYRAGFLAGYLEGQSWKVCGQMGSVSAGYAVERYGTQNHQFTRDLFDERYVENFGAIEMLSTEMIRTSNY